MILALLYSLAHLLLGLLSARTLYRMAKQDGDGPVLRVLAAVVGFLFWPIGVVCMVIEFLCRSIR